MHLQKALIATLPKSGTWYCHSFFWCYEQLLGRAWDYLDGRFTPDLGRALKEKKIGNRSTHRSTLGIGELFICHTTCPGFEELDDARAETWEALRFPLPSNWGEPWLRRHHHWEGLDPVSSTGARIVYLFRNPLDHFVSYWEHSQTHVDARHRTRTLADGTQVPVKDLHDFVFDFGMLGSFIKHYYSFRQMQRRFPSQILMMPYEHLTQSPGDAFKDILSFFGTPPTGVLRERLFADALTMCSKDSLAAIEAKMDRAIAADQVNGGRHIRDGSIGKWQKHFSRDEVEAIESVLNSFDISLTDFRMGEGEAALEWLGSIDPARKAHHQREFFQRLNSRERGEPLGLGKRLIEGMARMKHSLFRPADSVSDEAGM